jgi:predicted RNase H-like HicB family nuclease
MGPALTKADKNRIATPASGCLSAMRIEFEREDDGRWIGEIPDLLGVMAYGNTRQEAYDRVTALAFRVLADRISTARRHQTGPITCSRSMTATSFDLARIAKHTGGDL